MAFELVIFDLDDTLISTEKLYREAKQRAATRLEELGVDYETALLTIKQIDQDHLRSMGTSKSRFPLSLRSAYLKCCKLYGIKSTQEEAQWFSGVGYEVFDTPSETFDNSERVLDSLRSNHRMCVLTRGDKEVQSKRMVQSGLTNYFDQFFVVDKKTPELFRKICDFYNVEPRNALMVGNSIYGDIYPALEANLFGFYIKNGTYELEGAYSISPEHHERMSFGPDIMSVLEYIVGERENG